MATYYEYGYSGRTGFPEDWVQIADVDESRDYEIDQTRIYRTPSGFALAVASGCSCWDGEWEAEEFDDLSVLLASFDTTDYAYNPSKMGVLDLSSQVQSWLND